jgi:G3E family GTPase
VEVPVTPSDPSSLIPVTVLTGFLGSGKTTVLNRLLKRIELAATAVIINEFGEVGLDHLLVELANEDFVVLNSGCLCCTVRGDLITTLRDLFLRRVKGEIPEFQRVVIETTGLADPAPVLHTLMTDPLVAARYRLDGVVVTVDAVNGMSTLDSHAEAVKQAAVADRILLTKQDLASADEMTALTVRLRALNAGTPILPSANGTIDPEAIFRVGLYDPTTKSTEVQRWLRDEAYAAEHAHGHRHDHAHGAKDDHGHGHRAAPLDVNRHDDRIHTFCIVRDGPVLWDSFAAWLEIMAAMRGDDLLRVKGIVNIVDRPGRPVVVHGVQHLFHPPVLLDAFPSEDHRTRLVFIVRDIEREAIEDTLRVFGDVTPAQIAAAERRATR